MNLGERIKNLRQEKGLTQSEFADKLGVHPQTVSRWERCVVEPDFSMLAPLCDTLGVTVEKLVDGRESDSSCSGSFDSVKMGKLIARKRKELAITQAELAEKISTTGDNLSKWERGITCPDVERFKMLSEILGVSLSSLYYGVYEKKTVCVENVKGEKGLKDGKTLKLTSILLVASVIFITAIVVMGYQINKIKAQIEYSLEQAQSDDGIYKIDFEKEWIVPVEYTSILFEAEFRHSKTLNQYEMHNGVDFAAPIDSPVYAVNGGVVKEILKDSIDGWEIKIYHGEGLYSIYKYVTPCNGIEEGKLVKKGDRIASIALAEGFEYKDGEHLHFEMTEYGQNVDVSTYINYK